MAGVSYLMRRGGSYSARVRIPKDLVPLYNGKREIVRALGTNALAEAKRRLHPVVAMIQREFDDLRARSAITTQDFGAAVWDRYTAALQADEDTRAAYPTLAELEVLREATLAKLRSPAVEATPLAVLGAGLDFMVANGAREFDRNARVARLAALKRDLAANETHLIDHEVDDFLGRHKLLAPEGSAERTVLARHLMRAEIEAMQRTLERDAGDCAGTPSDPIVKPSTGTRARLAEPGERILDLFDRYATENPRGSRAETLQQARGAVEVFAQFVGLGAGADAFTKKAVRDFKALLMKLPKKSREAKVFRGMSLQQIVKANETHGMAVLSPPTVNRYLSSLSAFATWLAANDYLDANPVPGMTVSARQDHKKDTFTTDQLNTLFRSPLFTGCRDDEGRKLAEPGNLMIRDYRFWVPLVMLFSGARPAEVAQLEVADVREENGIAFLAINPEGEDKRVKTAGSARIVPLHPELIRLGFMDLRNAMKKAGANRLFPTAERNAKGQMIADWSRAFPKYLVNIGMRSGGSNLSLYSFRHGAIDAMRQAGYLDEQFGFLMGHGAKTMTGRYGNLPQGMLEQRAELIRAILYPGLDLSHLYQTP